MLVIGRCRSFQVVSDRFRLFLVLVSASEEVEFFSLVFEDAQKHIMTGGNNGFRFLHDVRKLADGQFFRFRQLIASSLLHGSPGPRNLIESVAKHMLRVSIICSTF